MLDKGGEVVTRQPYRKVWLDHLLSKEIEDSIAILFHPKLISDQTCSPLSAIYHSKILAVAQQVLTKIKKFQIGFFETKK